MPKKIVIVGAVALGPKVASRARRLDPEADILMIDRDPLISYGGCGIPYYVGGDVADIDGLRNTTYHMIRDEAFFRDVKHVQVMTRTEVLAIDRKAKTLRVKELASGDEADVAYDALVLGTGGAPVKPPLPGVDLPGVSLVADLHQAERIKKDLATSGVEKAVVIGAGAIGLEMAEALGDLWGVEVTVVELQPTLLPMALEPDMAGMVRQEYEQNGVSFRLGEKVTAIIGEGRVEAVELGSGERLPCQLVILSVGVRPNAQLARQAGLAIGRLGGVLVDQRMRSSDPNIYAGGDCVEVPNLLTGATAFLPLGSMANRQGRVIGSNVAGGADVFPGVVGSFILKAFGLGVARSGLTMAQAREAGFDPVTAHTSMADRAHFYPTQSMMHMQIIADRKTQRVLGVQAVGKNGDAVKARVDAVAALLPHAVSLQEISNLEVAYAPPYAGAMDIVNAAANAVRNVIDGLVEPMDMFEFMETLKKTGMKVLDVREAELSTTQKEKFGERWINIPLHELPNRLDEIPGEQPLAVFCNTGLRSYEAARFLAQKGFKDLRNVTGGYSLMRHLEGAAAKDE